MATKKNVRTAKKVAKAAKRHPKAAIAVIVIHIGLFFQSFRMFASDILLQNTVYHSSRARKVNNRLIINRQTARRPLRPARTARSEERSTRARSTGTAPRRPRRARRAACASLFDSVHRSFAWFRLLFSVSYAPSGKLVPEHGEKNRNMMGIST